MQKIFTNTFEYYNIIKLGPPHYSQKERENKEEKTNTLQMTDDK